jgi:hypothetical protein
VFDRNSIDACAWSDRHKVRIEMKLTFLHAIPQGLTQFNLACGDLPAHHSFKIGTLHPGIPIGYHPVVHLGKAYKAFVSVRGIIAGRGNRQMRAFISGCDRRLILQGDNMFRFSPGDRLSIEIEYTFRNESVTYTNQLPPEKAYYPTRADARYYRTAIPQPLPHEAASKVPYIPEDTQPLPLAPPPQPRVPYRQQQSDTASGGRARGFQSDVGAKWRRIR